MIESWVVKVTLPANWSRVLFVSEERFFPSSLPLPDPHSITSSLCFYPCDDGALSSPLDLSTYVHNRARTHERYHACDTDFNFERPVARLFACVKVHELPPGLAAIALRSSLILFPSLFLLYYLRWELSLEGKKSSITEQEQLYTPVWGFALIFYLSAVAQAIYNFFL